jgi:hypothetical protein
MLWFKSRKQVTHTHTLGKPRRFRPALEQLEDRTVPSVVDQVVNALFAEHWSDNGLGGHPASDTAKLRLLALADGGNPGGSGGGAAGHASPGHASTGAPTWTAASPTAVNQLTQVVSIQGTTANRGHGPQTVADASLLLAEDGSGGVGRIWRGQ